MILKLLRALTAMSAATHKQELLASDEIGSIALGAALRSWRRQVHIRFAYYKLLIANPLPRLNKHGGMEVSMSGHSDFPDGHRERGLETLRDAPLSDMDLMKRHDTFSPIPVAK